MKTSRAWFAQPFAWVLGSGTLYLLWIMFSAQGSFPLQDWAFEDNEWTKSWLTVSIFDYYLAAASFCTVVVFTEETPVGVAWCVSFLSLGSPMIVLYVILRYRTHQNLALVQKSTNDYEILSRIHSHSIS